MGLLDAVDLSAVSAPAFLRGMQVSIRRLRALEDGNPEHQQLLAHYNDAQGSNGIRPAHSLLCKPTMSVKVNCRASVQSILDADVLTTRDNPRRLNNWVDEVSGGMIPRLLDKLDQSSVAVLVHAMAFKGNWTTAFSTNATVRGTFHSLSKGALPCAMMT